MIAVHVTNAMVVIPVAAYAVTDLTVSVVQWRRRRVDARRRYTIPEPRRHVHPRDGVTHRR